MEKDEAIRFLLAVAIEYVAALPNERAASREAISLRIQAAHEALKESDHGDNPD